MPIESMRVRFRGAYGDWLAASLDQPRERPVAYALMAHCFSCSKDAKAVRRVSRGLTEHGIAVLRFDFTGLGESEGDFAETNFSSNLDDLIAAADYLRQEYQAPRLLLGHSLGGTAALTVASRIDEVQGVCAIASPSGTEHLKDLLVRKAPEVDAQGEAEVELAGRRVRIRRQLLEDLDHHRVSDAVQNLNKALFVFHSPGDQIVDIEEAHEIFEAANYPKSFISLDRADHLLLSHEEDSRFIADVLAAWLRRQLDA